MGTRPGAVKSAWSSRPGEQVGLQVDAAAANWFDPASGHRLAA
jgi:hypothetical protein